MKLVFSLVSLMLFLSGFTTVSHAQELQSVFNRFEQLYQTELGSTQGCSQSSSTRFSVCSSALRNDGNAPYILHHGKPTGKVIVLFHGLSDSPFFLRSVAEAFYGEGYNVVVALLPGHGLLDADKIMEDPELANRWRKHVADVIALADGLAENTFIGGFSTGGALATEYTLLHPEKLQGLMLFSGALRLESKAEILADVWGMRWIAKKLDGDYLSQGRNPVKYPSVSTFAAFQLVDVIMSVRELIEAKHPLNLPLFVAHSQADATTLIRGVTDLMAYNQGDNQFFDIPQTENVCHADLVISEQQLIDMNYDMNGVEPSDACSVPKANPLHPQMLQAALRYLRAH
ncbi:MAG: lysophospholipase [Paraglaciecola sp.]|nr:lysophospholipase [Paraglaciecola sp.]